MFFYYLYLMRLTKDQRQNIIRTAEKIYGSDVKVFLFGSRTKDGEKGGDIDLMIRTDRKKRTLKNKIMFLISLKKEIGDQKVDVIYERRGKGSFSEKIVNKDRIAL